MTASVVRTITKHFAPGWGGAPESVRLMARLLRPIGVSLDVFAVEGVFRDVGTLDCLPASVGTGRLDGEAAIPHDAVLIVGPWNTASPREAARARIRGIPVTYAPRGGLSRIEFQRKRDMKKLPYLAAVESICLVAANSVLFSSQLERSRTVPLAGLAHGVVLPDPFVPSWPVTSDIGPAGRRCQRVGFLGEISPRKAFREVVDAFMLLASRPGPELQLVVGGRPRPGSESYFDHALASASPGAVRWVGPVAPADRADFYRSVDLLIVPSKFESFGLVVAEALSCGRPVLVSSSVGILEHMPDSPAVQRLERVTASAIAAAVARCVAEWDRVTSNVPRAQQAVLSDLGGAHLAQAYANLLLHPREREHSAC